MGLSQENTAAARAALVQLLPGRKVGNLAPLGNGHINDTYLVTFVSDEPRQVVLQRLNRAVFPEPEKIMANLAILAEHLANRIAQEPPGGVDPRMVVSPLGGQDGRGFFSAPDGDFWRLLTYVEGTEHQEVLATPESAREAGRGLGVFHRLVADLDSTRLVDTLPGFHYAPGYLATYDRQISLRPVIEIQPDDVYCREIIAARRGLVEVLEEAARRGEIHPRVIHGDPRLANLLFDRSSGKAVALVDLDTVKPGLLHYDLGDCLRSCCNPVGDDPENLAEVCFDLEICRGLLGGYLAEAGATLSPIDYQLIYPAVRLLAFELGLRFFNDHLAGDVYFKITRPGQNLQRALVQFRLLESIEAQELEIRAIVAAWHKH